MKETNLIKKTPNPVLFYDHYHIVSELVEKKPELLADKLWRIQNLYPIQDKTGRLIPFVLNKHQLKLVRLIKKNWALDYPEAITILKSRQVGITTFFVIWFLDDILTYSGISASIQAHKHESMNDIFKIARLAHDNMHQVYKKAETDKLSISTKTEITIGENNSRMEVKLEVRSKAINRMLFSEKAFTDLDRLTATEGSLAPDCLIANESTPKGLNHFHRLYRTEKEKGNSFFIPWWEHDEYSIPCPNGLDEKTPDEIKIQNLYPAITDDKLLFRRVKIEKMDLLPFEQEFPLNDIECFLLSGASLLDRRLLADMNEGAIKKEKVKILKFPNWTVDFYEIPSLEKLHRNPKAFFIGIDTAEGIGKDFSVTVVLSVDAKNHDINQAMIGYGHLPPDDHAMKTFEIIRDYFVFDDIWPFLVCERNNTGHAFLSILNNHPDYLYPNLYNFKDRRLGFQTTQSSRKMIIHDLFNAIRDKSLKINDTKTISELMTLTLTDSGKIEAEQGEHDDLVLANAFAYHGYFSTLGTGRFFSDEDAISEFDAF